MPELPEADHGKDAGGLQRLKTIRNEIFPFDMLHSISKYLATYGKVSDGRGFQAPAPTTYLKTKENDKENVERNSTWDWQGPTGVIRSLKAGRKRAARNVSSRTEVLKWRS